MSSSGTSKHISSFTCDSSKQNKNRLRSQFPDQQQFVKAILHSLTFTARSSPGVDAFNVEEVHELEIYVLVNGHQNWFVRWAENSDVESPVKQFCSLLLGLCGGTFGPSIKRGAGSSCEGAGPDGPVTRTTFFIKHKWAPNFGLGTGQKKSGK